eukprot:GFYU01012419.1.p1 GENE.GFYU01012419.1~~GFYU01012419.1.p1  ORF type:complete len:460 (+),score=112.80 GFYU01012419.1:124-1380(+)
MQKGPRTTYHQVESLLNSLVAQVDISNDTTFEVFELLWSRAFLSLNALSPSNKNLRQQMELISLLTARSNDPRQSILNNVLKGWHMLLGGGQSVKMFEAFTQSFQLMSTSGALPQDWATTTILPSGLTAWTHIMIIGVVGSWETGNLSICNDILQKIATGGTPSLPYNHCALFSFPCVFLSHFATVQLREALAATGLQIAKKHGYRTFELWCTVALCSVKFETGNEMEALREMQALLQYEEQLHTMRPVLCCIFADMLHKSGQLDKAMEVLQNGMHAVSQGAPPFWATTELHRMNAEILTKQLVDLKKMTDGQTNAIQQFGVGGDSESMAKTLFNRIDQQCALSIAYAENRQSIMWKIKSLSTKVVFFARVPDMHEPSLSLLTVNGLRSMCVGLDHTHHLGSVISAARDLVWFDQVEN